MVRGRLGEKARSLFSASARLGFARMDVLEALSASRSLSEEEEAELEEFRGERNWAMLTGGTYPD
jgi:hypothetical protein